MHAAQGSRLSSLFSERSHVDVEPLAQSVGRAGAGRQLWDLTQTNPTRVGLPYDQAALAAAFGADLERYEPNPLGDLAARAQLCELWLERGVHVGPENIALTASSSEAYGALFKLFCDPGQRVLVPEPSYPLFDELARCECVELVPYRLAYDGAWHLDLDSLRSAARTSDVRAVIVVSPNNPTGSWLSEEERQGVLSLGLPVISDEVFWAYSFKAGTPAAPSTLLGVDNSYDNVVIALDGLSKYAALPGAKLSWTTCLGGRAPELVSRLEFILDAYLSVNAPVQRALPGLLRASAVTRRALQTRLVSNLAQLDAAIAGSCVSRLDVQGGWVVVLRLPNTRSEAEWVQGLAEQAGVAVQPGALYGFAEQPLCVVSLLPRAAEFLPALTALVAYVQREA